MSLDASHTYIVSGMTCAHCVMSVTEEVSEVAGVDVELATGQLSVVGEGFTDEAVVTAVSEAGYEVIS